jgi:hypothetical protein
MCSWSSHLCFRCLASVAKLIWMLVTAFGFYLASVCESVLSTLYGSRRFQYVCYRFVMMVCKYNYRNSGHSKSKSRYNWRSVSQYVKISSPLWDLWPDFSFLSDSCEFLDVEDPLWREDGSAIYFYNCFWALPEELLSGPRPAKLTTIFYCLIWDSPNLEDQVPVFTCISPRNRVAQLYPRPLGSLSVASYDS